MRKTILCLLVARGNLAYTEVWGQFYGSTPDPAWDVADNQIEPYTPPPGGWLD